MKKATGGWQILHAFNKLNDATISVQTSIPRKDMVLNSMSGSVIFSAIDLTDGFYQMMKQHTTHSDENPEWHSMGMASDATTVAKCTGRL